MNRSFVAPAHLTIHFRNLAVFERRMKAKRLIVHMPNEGHQLSIDWAPLAAMTPPITLMAGDKPLIGPTIVEPAGRLTDLSQLTEDDVEINDKVPAWSLGLGSGFLQGLRPDLRPGFEILADYRWIFGDMGIHQLTNRAIFQLGLETGVRYQLVDKEGNQLDIPDMGIEIHITNNEEDGGQASLEEFLETGELREFQHLGKRAGLKVPSPACDAETRKKLGQQREVFSSMKNISIMCELPFCPLAYVQS